MNTGDSMLMLHSYLPKGSNGLAGSADNCLWKSLEGQMYCGLLKGTVDSISIQWSIHTGKVGEVKWMKAHMSLREQGYREVRVFH